MVIVCVTSFWIQDLRVWGPWRPIHVLAIFTLCVLPFAILHGRGYRVIQHRNAMISMFLAALVIAGLFTFVPDHARGCVRELI
jgi:uncharacterized membrane protein